VYSRLMLVIIASAALAFAQGERGGGGGPLTWPTPTKADQVKSKLKLNEDQTDEMSKILQAAFNEAAPLRQQILQGHGAFAEAVTGGDQGDIEKARKNFGDLEAKMIALEAAAFQKICALLKPNQAAKAGEAFELMADILTVEPPAGRGGQSRSRR
jgi:hypothetical protein